MTHSSHAVLGIILTLLCLPVFSLYEAVGQITSNVTIQTSDSVALEATITWPAQIPPSGGFPGIVLVHGFGGSKADMSEIALAMAVLGYASIAYSVRGQGNSGGLSTVSGAREVQDLREVIQYFRNTVFVNSNNLGVTGGSQGGIHAWMAAVYGMPGVKAVVPLIATPDFAHALVPNGCIKYGLPREMTIGSVRYSPERDIVRNYIIADQYDSVLSYINARDLAHLVHNVQIPVLQGLGWADFLFPVNGGIAAATNLASRHVPIWSYYGTNGHGEEIDPEEALFLADLMVSWFDHWLRGYSLSQDSLPVVHYADDRPGWPRHTTIVWPPLPHDTLTLYLTDQGLSWNPPTTDVTLPFSLSHDSAYTPMMGWDDLYGGANFMAAFTSSPVRLISPPLSMDIEVTGIPWGRISVQSNSGKFQAHVRFYDVVVAADTTWRLMSRSMNGIRQSTPAQWHEIDVVGTALSHVIPHGHRIGVEITSLDLLHADRANTVPYFASSHSFVQSTTSSPSFISLPVVGTVVTVAENRVPFDVFRLSQNYPNPFNPTTNFQFSIANSQFTVLKVYDVLGREVTTLINDQLAPGEYTVNWDARGQASGVYFYRLSAGDFVTTRKMILSK